MNDTELAPAADRRWVFPFADGSSGSVPVRRVLLIAAYLVLFHVIALEISKRVGTFESNPNRDHTPAMEQILAHGYPTQMHVPPGFAYYLAAKWAVTHSLGMPYWYAKYGIDVWFVLLSAALMYRLAFLLTRNTFVSLVSVLVLTHAPIYILGVGLEEAAIFFMPFFLLFLILTVREFQRETGPRISTLFWIGALIGLTTLIRGNTQFIVLAFAGFVLMGRTKRSSWKTPAVIAAFAACIVGQALMMTPWMIVQRHQGRDGLASLPSVYNSYFDGLKRHKGNAVCDSLLAHYTAPRRSLAGVIDFNLAWLRRNPRALIELYLLKFIRSWYISDSGRWDTYILLLHLPFWLFASGGYYLWRKKRKGDPAYLFLFAVIIYMWSISSVMGGIARYSAPLYGFIGVFIGAAAWTVLPEGMRIKIGLTLAVSGTEGNRE